MASEIPLLSFHRLLYYFILSGFQRLNLGDDVEFESCEFPGKRMGVLVYISHRLLQNYHYRIGLAGGGGGQVFPPGI